MRKVYDDKRLMLKVCDLYFNSNYKQETIAKKLSISRPTVSRLISNAKEEGIVKVEIINPFTNEYNKIEKLLENKFDLTEVVIVDDHEDMSLQNKELGKACAKYLQRVLVDSDIIGVSMGRTIKEISRYVKREKDSTLTFLPLLGGMGQLGIDVHCNQIVIDLARAFNGNYHLLHAPALLSDKALVESLKQDIHIKTTFELMEKMTVAVIGIGATDKTSTMMATGYFKDEDIQNLKKDGVVGDICLRIYDKEGRADYEFNNNIFGYDIHKLRKVNKVIALSGSREKPQAIISAIKGKFFNILITNYTTAKKMVEIINKEEG